jgi:hypothetical protein
MFLLIIPLATAVETAYGMSRVNSSREPELTDRTIDAFKKRHGTSTQHAHRPDDEQSSAAPTGPSDSQEETASYTLYWDNQVDSSGTSWISAVEVTSTTNMDMDMPLQPIGNGSHPTTSQIFHPDVETWTRVSLSPPGKNKRSTGAVYYFGSSRPFTTSGGHSRIVDVDADWEMEDGLYRRRGFRIAMLCVLAVLFCFLTSLGGGLIWAVRYGR